MIMHLSYNQMITSFFLLFSFFLFKKNRNKISDLDIDAALALQDTPIDGFEFPFIIKWLDLISNHIRESKKTKVTVALSIPNLNLSSLSFNSIGGDTSIQNESVMLKYITSPQKLIPF